MSRTYSTNEVNMNVYRILAGKPEGKRTLVKLRPSWLDNINMDL
jgi:hypothetical protein